MDASTQQWIAIPPGSYRVGLSRADVDRLWSGTAGGVRREFLHAACPAHAVRLEGVMISKRPVTRAEFGRFASSAGYRTEAEADGWGWISRDGRWHKEEGVSWRKPFGFSPADERYAAEERMPVMQVSWNDAAAYCRWLSSGFGAAVRLPREAEWEIFARVVGVPGFGDAVRDEPRITGANRFLDSVIEASRGGLFPPGLLWEWTEDWYDRYPGGGDNRDFGSVYRVLRGGSALSVPVQRTREFRLRKCPTARSPYYGFRVALTR